MYQSTLNIFSVEIFNSDTYARHAYVSAYGIKT